MKVATINTNYDSEDEESYSKIKILEPDEIRPYTHRRSGIVRPPIRNKDHAATSKQALLDHNVQFQETCALIEQCDRLLKR